MNSIWTLCLVGFGGMLGAILRFIVASASFHYISRNFPVGTLLVNIIGSFLIGFLAIILEQRLFDSDYLRAFLIIGVLGAFTTFSSFSWESLQLLQAGFWLKAVLNIFLNITLCLTMVIAGYQLGKLL